MKRSETGSWQANCEALRALGMSQFNLSRTEKTRFSLRVCGLWSLISALFDRSYFFSTRKGNILCA